MQAPTDLIAQQQRKMAERAAAGERARVANVHRFIEMFLTLGPDAAKLDGSRHDSELAEAKASAASRWTRLFDLESQVQREEQAVAARPKMRPAAPGDDLLPDRTLAERDRAFEEETKGRRDGLEVLKAQAKRERAELESFIGKK
jgi:hypothetical protein